MDILTRIQKRYATKKFNPSKKICDEDIFILTESLRLAPSSFGTQPWKFIIIQNQNLKESLVKYSRGQTQVRDCSHLLVLCVKKEIDDIYIKKHTDLLEDVWGKKRDEIWNEWQKIGKIERIQSYYDSSAVMEREVFLVLGFLLSTAAYMGIDTCPMGGIEAEKYDEVLGLQDGDYKTVVCCALGYKSEDDKYGKLEKVRFAREEVIEFV